MTEDLRLDLYLPLVTVFMFELRFPQLSNETNCIHIANKNKVFQLERDFPKAAYLSRQPETAHQLT